MRRSACLLTEVALRPNSARDGKASQSVQANQLVVLFFGLSVALTNQKLATTLVRKQGVDSSQLGRPRELEIILVSR